MPPLNEALRLLDGLYGERTVKRRTDEKDGVDEGLNVAKATRTLFGKLDHAVAPLGDRIAEPGLDGSHDALPVPLDHVRHVDDWVKTAVRGPQAPSP